ncbi:MAG: ABC transporter ATP-binding protein [Phycisphaerales bacterium]
MIHADQLSRSFGSIAAVRDVSFVVPKGTLTAFLGPNGAGKTTTIRMLAGCLPPTQGHASIDGFDTIRNSLPARARLGLLHEHNPLYPEMRVRDYLLFRAALHRVPRSKRAAASERAIERCQLRDVSRRRIGALSKGYRQRVGLAAAIIHDPSALILDEPTTGLDPSQILETRSLLRELAQDKAVLLSSHILPEVERICDRVIIIAHGTIRADDTPANLLASHAHDAPYVLECPSPDAPRLRTALTPLPHVTRAHDPTSLPGGWSRIEVCPQHGAPDLRETLARTAAQSSVLVREIRRDSPSLEAVFASHIASASASNT